MITFYKRADSKNVLKGFLLQRKDICTAQGRSEKRAKEKTKEIKYIHIRSTKAKNDFPWEHI